MYLKYHNKEKIFKKLNLDDYHLGDDLFPNQITGLYRSYDSGSDEIEFIKNHSPIDNSLLSTFTNFTNFTQCGEDLSMHTSAFEQWKQIPAPKRGDLIKHIGKLVNKKKKWLAALITLESGKPYQESLGEVQEWAD